jgi:hypothetical protein
VLPARIAEYRYANGKTPEGELVDLTEHFGRLKMDAERVAVGGEKQEALV